MGYGDFKLFGATRRLARLADAAADRAARRRRGRGGRASLMLTRAAQSAATRSPSALPRGRGLDHA